MQQPTAIVVDEFALARAGLAALLTARGCDVVGQTRSAREAVSLATIESVELVVCGSPADLSLADAVRRLLQVRPRPVVLALVPAGDDHIVSYVVAMGAAGVVLRTAEPEDIGAIIDAAMKGGQHVAPALHHALEGALSLPPLADRETELLSSREREVLVLLAQGRTNREMAAELSVTLATVKSHLVHIYAKLDATNRNEALGRAVSLGLLR